VSWLSQARRVNGHIQYMCLPKPGEWMVIYSICVLAVPKTHILYMTIHSPGLGQPRHIYCIWPFTPLAWDSQDTHIQYMCLGCPKPGEWMVIYSICVLAVPSRESEWSYVVYVSWMSQARRVNCHIQYLCLGCPKPGEWMVIYSICVFPSQESEWSYTVYVSSQTRRVNGHIQYMCLGCPKLGEWMVIYSICVFPSQESEWSYTVYVSWLSQTRRGNGHIQYMCLGCPKPGEWMVIYSHILYMIIHSPGLGQPRHIYCIWPFTLLAWDSQDTYTVYDHSLSWFGTAKTHILYMTIHSPQTRRVNGHIQYMCLGCPKPGEWMVIYSICVFAVQGRERA
jgi:hypothetical protein